MDHNKAEETDTLTPRQTVYSMSSFVPIVDAIASEWNAGTLWFRGVESNSYKLVPRLYRDEAMTHWTYDPEEANEVFDDFLLRARSFFGQVRRKYTPWEWYFLMQHYAVPTRLLDWTEGYLIALYFAVRNPMEAATPAVWVLNPFWLNEISAETDMVFYADPPPPV